MHILRRQPPLAITPEVLKQCKSLKQAKLLHQQLITQNLTHILPYAISSYLSSNSLSSALTVLLHHLSPSQRTVYWWNQLIKQSIRDGFFENGISLFRRMRSLGWDPDGFTLPYVLKGCGELRAGKLGRGVHGFVVVNGFEGNVFVCNAVVGMYGKCGGMLVDARKVFDEMFDRGVWDVVSWNSLVAGYVQGGEERIGLDVFGRMVKGDWDGDLGGPWVWPDVVSVVNVVPGCVAEGRWLWGKEIHGYVVKSGLAEDVFVGNAIVDLYAKWGKMDEAKKVFEKMVVKDVVSWNSMVTGFSQIGRFEDALALFERMRMEKVELDVVTWTAVIAGYAQRGLGYEALDVFREMKLSRSKPNVVTLASLLSGCASVGALLHGKETHCYAMKCMLNINANDPGDEMMVINGIIDMYAKCKETKFARTVFDLTAEKDRNVVTWTAMIWGYAQHGEASDALELFTRMFQRENFIKPNAFTISCALMACTRLAALRLGSQIHGYVLRNCYDFASPHVPNCFIDMYAKSGDVDAAKIVFDNMQHRNFVSWTSLMTGYSIHGRGEEAIQVFDAMRRTGIEFDGVPLLVLLYACSHSGMVDQGIKLFENMSEKFGVAPGVEHYACMVDLLGRAGRLNEAWELIKGMPMEPSPIIWVALLSACRNYANVELAEFAADKLAESQSVNDGTYTLLSNIYAKAGRWKDVARIRTSMKHAGIRKRPGCSWVQGKKGTATFYVGDRSHPLSQQIYEILADYIERIKAMGYVPETSFALHDVDEEEKGDLLFEHSEKLALAYGILTTPPGAPIHITKNLRICGDCHVAITYISKIIDNEIIIRDSSRFHHFKKGSCSCKGYW